MTEQWRPVPGYDGYEVSDRGRVRSLERTVIMSDGRKRHVTERLITTRLNGHTGVGLWKDNTRRYHPVARLIDAAFETSRRREVVP